VGNEGHGMAKKAHDLILCLGSLLLGPKLISTQVLY